MFFLTFVSLFYLFYFYLLIFTFVSFIFNCVFDGLTLTINVYFRTYVLGRVFNFTQKILKFTEFCNF